MEWGWSTPYKPVLQGQVKPSPNFKIISEPIQDMLDHLLSGHSGHTLDVASGVCVKSPTLDEVRPGHMFISQGSPHFISRFCKAE